MLKHNVNMNILSAYKMYCVIQFSFDFQIARFNVADTGLSVTEMSIEVVANFRLKNVTLIVNNF